MTIDDLLNTLGGRKAIVAKLEGSKDMCAKWIARGYIPDAAQMKLVRAFPDHPVVKYLAWITGGMSDD